MIIDNRQLSTVSQSIRYNSSSGFIYGLLTVKCLSRWPLRYGVFGKPRFALFAPSGRSSWEFHGTTSDLWEMRGLLNLLDFGEGAHGRQAMCRSRNLLTQVAIALHSPKSNKATCAIARCQCHASCAFGYREWIESSEDHVCQQRRHR